MKRILMSSLVLAMAFAALAADRAAHLKWADTPEAYFLTNAERTEFLALANQEAADAFVASFREKRGGEAFTKEVGKRVEMADKYLTVGKTKGSATLRGKLVVLFGAPAAMQAAERRGRSDYSGGASDMGGGGELGVGVSASTPGGTQAVSGRGSASKVVTDYTFTFSSKNVPALGSDYTVVVEVDPATGKDKLKDKKAAAELDAKLEAVAQAMVRK